MSDNEQQKESAANNADQSPPPQDTAGEKIGEAIRVPTLTQPPPRRSDADDDKGTGKKKKEKHTPSSNKQETGPSGPKTPAVKRSDRTPSRDKKKPKTDKGPSGTKTPPGEPVDNSPRSTQPPPKGSSEPTGTPKNTSVFRIPKIKDARPVRDLKEEAAAHLREKNLSAKNYAKATAFPHYVMGSHPLNPEEAEEWEVTPVVKSGGLASSYVALGRNAEHYKPKPKGSYDPTSQPDQTESSDPTSQTSSKGPSGPTRTPSDDHPSHKRGRTSSHTSSERSSDEVSRQEKRDRHKRGERSRQQSPYGRDTGHRSRADSATGQPGPLKPPQQLHTRSRSQERSTARAAQKQKELAIISTIMDNVYELQKLLELDMLAAGQGAPSGARRAGGLPSMTAEELRKKIAREQLDQEMDVRRERANSGQGHMAAPSIDDATDESKRESSDSKGEQRASPAPLDYEAEEAADAAYEADALDKAKYLAARVTFPGGKTFAERKAEPAIVQAAAETFAERKGQRVKAAIEESKKTKPSDFSRRDDSAVLDYPEFDDSYWDIDNCPRPFELAEPVNPSRWSIMLPNPKRTYFEPLGDCRDHDVDNDPHLRIEDAIPSFRIICKEKGGRRPAEASAIGRLHISSYGKMYLILWASRHHMKPRQDPANEPQRANLVVLEFINAVARHRSSELPRLLDEYFDRIRDGFTDDPFSPYDFKTVIMRWYDSCPNAAAFYDAHAAGPIYYNPPFLQGCR